MDMTGMKFDTMQHMDKFCEIYNTSVINHRVVGGRTAWMQQDDEYGIKAKTWDGSW